MKTLKDNNSKTGKFFNENKRREIKEKKELTFHSRIRDEKREMDNLQFP
jgi:hypothetical protein